MKKLFRLFTDSHVLLLVFWTILVGIASLMIFVWLMNPENFIYHLDAFSAPLPNTMSQESSGYFGALGGWAIGFAGALVAIRIAGVATSIQQNDSLRAREELLETEVNLISGYNSRIIMALLESKRACAAVLIDIQNQKDQFVRDQRKQNANPIFHNDINGGQTFTPSEQAVIQPLERISESVENRSYLITKLTDLVREIECAVRDPAFIKAARATDKTQAKAPPLDDFCTLLANSAKNPKPYADMIQTYSKVILEDAAFFDFIQTYENATHNFAAGINDLRADSLYQSYTKDIEQLITEMKGNDKDSLNPSEAAWVLLGMLLLQEFGKKPHQAQRFNQGFLFIGLMLGSLPNNLSVYQYFDNKLEDSLTDYSKSAIQKLKKQMKVLADSVYFPHGKNQQHQQAESGLLREINDVLVHSIQKTPSLLIIKAETRGLSLTDDKTRNTENGSSKNIAKI